MLNFEIPFAKTRKIIKLNAEYVLVSQNEKNGSAEFAKSENKSGIIPKIIKLFSSYERSLLRKKIIEIKNKKPAKR
jgi:hypothetical protein